MNKKFAADISEFSNAVRKLDGDAVYKCLLTDETAQNFWAYRNSYLIGHIDRLGLVYEAVFKTVGENNFKFLARKHLLACPPYLENMDDYGNLFASFLLDCDEVKDIPFLPDLAKLDWFLYAQLASGQSLILPQGSLALWQAIRTGKTVRDISINEETTETVRAEFLNSEYVLIKNNNE